jgi:hypothetical protein
MDLRRDRLEVQHDLIASHENPVIIYVAVASAFIANVESQLGLVERNRCAQVVNNEERGNTVQH